MTNFSYSQPENYKLCPLQYKYSYFLRIPISPSATLSFGNTIHKTLQDFYQLFIKNKNSGKEIMEIFKRFGCPLAITSLSSSKDKKEGRLMLKKFLIKFHNKRVKIFDLEKTFKIKLSKESISLEDRSSR